MYEITLIQCIKVIAVSCAVPCNIYSLVTRTLSVIKMTGKQAQRISTQRRLYITVQYFLRRKEANLNAISLLPIVSYAHPCGIRVSCLWRTELELYMTNTLPVHRWLSTMNYITWNEIIPASASIPSLYALRKTVEHRGAFF